MHGGVSVARKEGEGLGEAGRERSISLPRSLRGAAQKLRFTRRVSLSNMKLPKIWANCSSATISGTRRVQIAREGSLLTTLEGYLTLTV